jgi:hypothetical protein
VVGTLIEAGSLPAAYGRVFAEPVTFADRDDHDTPPTCGNTACSSTTM